MNSEGSPGFYWRFDSGRWKEVVHEAADNCRDPSHPNPGNTDGSAAGSAHPQCKKSQTKVEMFFVYEVREFISNDKATF